MPVDPIAFAVRRWQFTALAVLLLMMLGTSAFLSVPCSEDPQFNAPIFIVIAALPGADPAEIEQLVVEPLEDTLDGLDGVETIRSTAQDGVARVSVEFDWSHDPERKYDEVLRELNALRPQLPSGVTRVTVLRARPSDTVMAQVALTSDTLPWREFEQLADRLRERLDRIDGVSEATLEGVPPSEVGVVLDPGRLARLGLSPIQVADALRAAGAETPLGAVHVGDRRFNFRSGGAFDDLEQVRRVAVATVDGRVVRVGDVATVEWTTAEPEQLAFHNGKRAIFIPVTQRIGADVNRIAAAIDAEVEDFRRTLPGGVALHRGFDQSTNVKHRLGHLYRDFGLALALVALTLAPLGFRAAAVVMVSIPLSLALAIWGLGALGFTLNQLAISGFVLALGLLVDDSIVVVENIARRLREGEYRMSAAINGARQIAVPVLGCTLTLMLAFMPMLFMPGGSGVFIRSLPVSVLLCVGASLLVAMLVIPFLSSRLLPRHESEHGNVVLRLVQRGIHEAYRPILHRALDRPWISLGVIAAICLTAVPMLGAIGASLFPPAEIPQMLVRIETPDGTSLAATERTLRKVEARLRREPEVRWTMSSLGGGNPRIYYNTPQQDPRSNFAEVFVELKRFERGVTPRLLAELRRDFAALPGARISLIEFEQGPAVEAPIAIRIAGEDIVTLRRLAAEVERALEATPGARDVSNPVRLDRLDLDLGFDAGRAGRLGVSEGAVRRLARLAVAGEASGRLIDERGDAYPVSVRLPNSGGGRAELDLLGSVYVPAAGGAPTPLAQVATPSLTSGPARIERHDRQRAVTVTARVDPGYLTGEVTAAAMRRVERIPLPSGYAVSLGGEAEARSDSFSGLGAAALAAIFGILAVLVLQFGSFRSALVVAGIIPLGVFGAVAGLWLGGWSLSFTAAIGIVALIGIEIKNSILLVDFAEQLRRQGVGLREAIEQAGEIRFLPVLLTSATAIGGLLPLALSGSGLFSPMACAIIGGLVTSTLLSRVATPVMYLLLAERENRPAAEAAALPQPLPAE